MNDDVRSRTNVTLLEVESCDDTTEREIESRKVKEGKTVERYDLLEVNLMLSAK